MSHAFTTAALLLAITTTAPAQGQGLYVVGDSLSYDGRLFAVIGTPNAPYYLGRFSDGLVYSEQLAEATGRTLHNLAEPDATTSAVLMDQILPLIASHNNNLPTDGLYVYWAGANDLLDLLSLPGGNPQQVITNAVTQTMGALGSLLGAGAQEIVVINLPDLSLTPRVLALNDPTAIAQVQALAAGYNQTLEYYIGQLNLTPGIDITTVDSFGLLNNIAADPKPFRLRVVDEPRLQTSGATWPRNRCFLFFDDIHPSFGGHRAVMWTVMSALGETIPGDVNADYLVNIDDLTAMGSFYGPCSASSAADLNGDLHVDSRDRKLLLTMLAQH